jgi:hypothetical protein
VSSLQVNWEAGQSGEAYVINDGVTIVDIATQAVKQVVPISMVYGPIDSCLSPNGLIAVDVAEPAQPADAVQTSDLFLVDPAAGTFRNLSPPYYDFRSCAFSNDGTLLYGFGATHEGYNLVALDVASGKVAKHGAYNMTWIYCRVRAYASWLAGKLLWRPEPATTRLLLSSIRVLKPLISGVRASS